MDMINKMRLARNIIKDSNDTKAFYDIIEFNDLYKKNLKIKYDIETK